jgi:hypothetical protein
MLATAVIGGVLAVIWMLKPGGMLSDLFWMFLAALPLVGSKFRSKLQAQSQKESDFNPLTFPYGVAIGLGAFLVLTVRWWTEYDVWFL